MNKIHQTADVSEKAKIGGNTFVWHQSQIREGAEIGDNCIIGKGVYIDKDVLVGQNCKIQNYACLFHGAILEEGVFIGPGVIVTNDKYPRAINEDGTLKTENDWHEGKVTIKKGSSLGAGVIILPGIEIGEYSLIGAGTVVTKNIPPFSLVVGNPGKIVGRVNKKGEIVEKI